MKTIVIILLSLLSLNCLSQDLPYQRMKTPMEFEYLKGSKKAFVPDTSEALLCADTNRVSVVGGKLLFAIKDSISGCAKWEVSGTVVKSLGDSAIVVGKDTVRLDSELYFDLATEYLVQSGRNASILARKFSIDSLLWNIYATKQAKSTYLDSIKALIGRFENGLIAPSDSSTVKNGLVNFGGELWIGDGTKYKKGTGATTEVIDTTIYISNIKQSIANRHYDRIVKVTSTIKSAIASITDASYSKRYLLYVPNGTYNEDSLYCKSYIDIVGESRNGVIVQSSSGDWDTFWAGGIEFMLANMTIRHTNNIGDPGANKYPVHIDAAGDSKRPSGYSSASSTTILYNLNMEALGTNAKAGLGIGLRGYQRLYVIECNATSAATSAIYAHNQTGGTLPAALYLVNTSAAGLTDGFRWQNDGSTADDHIYITGGEYSSITTVNGGSGTGEAYIAIDSSISTTITLVDASKRLSHPFMIPIPQQNIPQYKEYTGIINTAPDGVRIGASGDFISLRSDGRFYVANGSGNIAYFDAGRFRPIPNDYIISLSNNLQAAIQSVSSGRYVRVTATNLTAAQWDGTTLSQYGPMMIGSSSLPATSSSLELSDSTRAFRFNRITNYRKPLLTPLEAHSFWNTDSKDFEIYNGTAFQQYIKNQFTAKENKSLWVEKIKADSVLITGLGIGTANAEAPLHIVGPATAFIIESESSTGTSIRRRASGGGAVTSGLNLGRFRATPYDGTSFSTTTGQFQFVASENHTTGAKGTHAAMQITPNGTTTAITSTFWGNTGEFVVGSETLTASSMMTVKSPNNDKGSKPAPDLTTAQMLAIPSPTEGLEVWNTTEKAKMVFDGTRWTGFRFNGTKFQGWESVGATWVDLN